MSTVRIALTKEDFDSTSGTPIDCPKFPATKLIDDINEVIVDSRMTSGPYLYVYKISDYPPSHHI